MRARHMRKEPRFLIARGALAIILVLALSISSVATVTANTVTANVIDGDLSYTFSMNSTDLNEILAQAEELGLEPLGPLDVAERVENTTTVNIRRGIRLQVTEAGKSFQVLAYEGDTVEQALENNHILLNENDSVTPERDRVLSGDETIEVKRFSEVTVSADGAEQTVTLVGGTVADALAQAGVTVGEKDEINYGTDEPLFDKMHIRVSRVMKIKITADGETVDHEISAVSVANALEKCGITLDEDDRVIPELTDKVTEGMEIVVKRVTIEELTETVDTDYTTETLTSDEMYVDQMKMQTAGVKGQKEVTYKVCYVDGEEESREVLSETVITEPTAEVVVKGTKKRPAASSSAAGTFVDINGNTVSYSKMLSGTCTAYSVPGGTTSLGWKAEYGVIAVNPNVIPYGTRMYITSPDGSIVYGYGVAGDTGGACMSGRIIADLCYNTVAECSIIGRRTMNIYILS